MALDLYNEVTNQIVEMLEQGVIPWRSPVFATSGKPKNLVTKKEYRGINTFLLAVTGWSKGYTSQYWLTYNQAKSLGGTVKKGEKSEWVVFWKQLETKDKVTGEDKRVPLLRYYNVFNVKQCDGIEAPDLKDFNPLDFHPIDKAETIVNGYKDGPEIKTEGIQASYKFRTDTVCMPDKTLFRGIEEYYATLFHELSHSTGHSLRLDRKIDTEPHPFGSPDYATEELVAEMSASFLCGHAGISPVVIENSAAYIQGWLKRLKNDKKLIIQAAAQAQKSADWILGVTYENIQQVAVNVAEENE